jgi:GNAT superfamily N-acetyltransferase
LRGGEQFVRRESLPEPIEDAFQALLEDPGAALFAGTVDGTAVGYAVVMAEGVEANVRELAVDPLARSVGVGEALLEACIAWAREHGCTGIGSYALPGARETKNFFEAAGMKARLLVVHRSL